MTSPDGYRSRSESAPKLKVAIIHPDLGIGGAERLIVDAAVELSAHGHDVHVFTSHHDRNRCFEETVTGLFPVTVYGSFLPRHVFYHFHAICAYMRCIFVALSVLLLWETFDVVLVDQVSIVIPLLKIKRSMKVIWFRIPFYTSRTLSEVIWFYCYKQVVFYCHFPDLLLAKHTTWIRKLYRKPIDMIEEATTGMADLILVNSKFTAATFANTFRRLHCKGIEPAALYPAVNINQFTEARDFKLNYLSINRFERKKNIQLAISAFAMLQSSRDDVILKEASLTIAGGFDKRLKENVEYLEELKKLAETEGISDRVNFVTSCSTAERNAMLSECICVIYTPKDEHFGIVPLEAMAAYKPVIACNSGGPTETVKHEITGYLCNPTPTDFALAMSKLSNDLDLAKSMGYKARCHVEESFSTRTFGDQLNRYIINVHHRRIE